MKTGKSLVWHRYAEANLFAMAKALTQAFRISAEALDVGLHEWDFSAVQKDSTDACDPNLTWHFKGSDMRESWHWGTVSYEICCVLNVWEIGGVKKKGVVCRIYQHDECLSLFS